MDNTIVKQIIEDAAKLAEQSVVAFKAQKRLEEIEPLFNEATKKASELEENTKTAKEEFTSGLEKVAEVLATRGILEESNKAAFINAINEKPAEVFNVIEKLASELKAESFGGVGSLPASSDLDPFERLAVGA
jgi:predicted transcriptional regulator